MVYRTAVCPLHSVSLQHHQRCHPRNHRRSLEGMFVAESNLRKTCQSLVSESAHRFSESQSRLPLHHTALRTRTECQGLAEHLQYPPQSHLRAVPRPVSFGPSHCGDPHVTSLLSWMGARGGLWDWTKAISVHVQRLMGHLPFLSITSFAFSLPFNWKVLSLCRLDSHAKLPTTSLLWLLLGLRLFEVTGTGLVEDFFLFIFLVGAIFFDWVILI